MVLHKMLFFKLPYRLVAFRLPVTSIHRQTGMQQKGMLTASPLVSIAVRKVKRWNTLNERCCSIQGPSSFAFKELFIETAHDQI